MKKMKLILGLALATFVLGQGAKAIQITGEIGIVPGFGNQATIDIVANTVAFAGPAQVQFNNGDYAGIGPAAVSYADFTYAPLAVVNPLWSISALDSADGRSASFAVTSMTIEFETSSKLVLSGSGVASLTGFDDTPGSWSFSADKSAGSTLFAWSSTTSATASVPDSGATAALLGLGLIALTGAARRFRK